jgi:hypothetical protein
MMAPWIESKREYIETDFRISDLAPERLTLLDLYSILGEKVVYSLADAKRVQKKQLADAQYKAMMDAEGGFSPNRMLDLLKMRCGYVLKRGSTLNNPHIPKATLDQFPKITENHAVVLRELAGQSLKI